MKRATLILLSLPYFCFSATSLSTPFVHKNALWAGSIFLRGSNPTTNEKLTDEKIRSLADRLKQNNIHYVYLFSGPFQNDGQLPDYAFSKTALQTVLLLKMLDPSLMILPWIGGVQGKTVHVENEAWRESALRSTAKLVSKIPFDGLHLDLEQVLFPRNSAPNLSAETYDAAWVQFHKRLREKLPAKFISTTLVSTVPDTRPWKHKHSIKDVLEISRSVDQISFMFYDTHLKTFELFRKNMRAQIEQMAQIKTELGSKAPEQLLAIGTFEAKGALRSYRDMRFENVESTLKTLNELTRSNSPLSSAVDGIAIYGDWTSKPSDWKQVRDLWTNR